MNLATVSLIITVLTYLVSHTSLKKFEDAGWISVLMGLIGGCIYEVIKRDGLKNLPETASKGNIFASMLGQSLAGAIIGLIIIIFIDKKIYGKNPRK